MCILCNICAFYAIYFTLKSTNMHTTSTLSSENTNLINNAARPYVLAFGIERCLLKFMRDWATQGNTPILNRQIIRHLFLAVSMHELNGYCSIGEYRECTRGWIKPKAKARRGGVHVYDDLEGLGLISVDSECIAPTSKGMHIVEMFNRYYLAYFSENGTFNYYLPNF